MQKLGFYKKCKTNVASVAPSHPAELSLWLRLSRAASLFGRLRPLRQDQAGSGGAGLKRISRKDSHYHIQMFVRTSFQTPLGH